MSAIELIKHIRELPNDEQAKVKRFIGENLRDGQISGEEIGELARRLAEASNASDKARLREEITKGFYGNAPHA